jgi:glycosyltransferase involved in cell wall biosynthesis
MLRATPRSLGSVAVRRKTRSASAEAVRGRRAHVPHGAASSVRPALHRAAAEVTLVVTDGQGSMDRYGQLLARHLPGQPAVTVGLSQTSVGAMGVGTLSRAALRGLPGDVALVRRLRRMRAPLHLTNHHLARHARLLRAPYVVTAHDAIRWLDVERGTGYIWQPSRTDRFWTRRDYEGIAQAAAAVAPSEWAKRELVEHLGVPAERVFVVALGVEHERFRPGARPPVDGRYVLFVGSEHPRKNLPLLLRAFAALRRESGFRDVRLVKVGEAGTREAPYRAMTLAPLRELGLQRHVLFTGVVADDDLASYYCGAAALVLPSRAEGFGLPPLEAMACGCPVIVSSAGACLRS